MEKKNNNPISQILSLDEFTKAIDDEYERRQKDKELKMKTEIKPAIQEKFSNEEIRAKKIETIKTLKQKTRDYIYNFCESHNISKTERQNLEAMVFFNIDAAISVTDESITQSDINIFDFKFDF